MFGKIFEKLRKEIDIDDEVLNFASKNYIMQDRYDANNLVVANLEYISSKIYEENQDGPMVIETELKYIFEKLNQNGKTRYREVFTGFIADVANDEIEYFDLPHVIKIVPLKEELPESPDNIPKFGLLLTINDINSKGLGRKLKKH